MPIRVLLAGTSDRSVRLPRPPRRRSRPRRRRRSADDASRCARAPSFAPTRADDIRMRARRLEATIRSPPTPHWERACSCSRPSSSRIRLRRTPRGRAASCSSGEPATCSRDPLVPRAIPAAPSVTRRLSRRTSHSPTSGGVTPEDSHELSPRELEVLGLVAQGAHRESQKRLPQSLDVKTRSRILTSCARATAAARRDRLPAGLARDLGGTAYRVELARRAAPA